MGDTRAIGFLDYDKRGENVYSLKRPGTYCTGSYYYDVLLNSCVNASACVASGRFIQQALCVKTCTPGYLAAGNFCYQECPYWLGFSSTANGCTFCANKLASNVGCVSQCTQKTFGNGCFSECPEGTIESGSACIQPANASSCTGVHGYFANKGSFNGNQYYNVCTSVPLAGMFNVNYSNQTKNEFDFQCNGFTFKYTCARYAQFPSEPLELASLISETQTIGQGNETDKQSICLQSFNISGQCSPSCPPNTFCDPQYGN